MIPDLSGYDSYVAEGFHGFEKIRLNDYEVCQLLGNYLIGAMSWIEGRGDHNRIRKVVLTPESIRAYTHEAEGFGPEYIEVKLPKGLYERAVDLSLGPLSPFPVHGPSEQIKLFLGRLHQVTFPEPGPKVLIPKHLIMNASNFADVRTWWSYRMDHSSMRDELMIGLQGELWELDPIFDVPSGDEPPKNPKPQGRSVKVWTSRVVPVGSIGVAATQPPPHWADKLKFIPVTDV